MDKYLSSPTVVTNTKGPKYYTTGILNSIPEEEIPFYYTAVEGDRLDVLSNRFYGTPEYWWVIAKANNLANGTIAVSVARQLFIPNI
jgi:nucleoid-associated protein YgaU